MDGHLIKLHLWDLLGAFFGFEVFFPLQVQYEVVGQIVRKLSDGCVELLYRLIISLAGHIDSVFRPLKLVLQIQEILIGLKVWISFHNYQKTG